MTQRAPTPPPPRGNLAARAGAWSARHRWKAILGWIAFVVVATVIGATVGTKTLTDEDRGTGDSARADQIVRDSFPQSAEENVLVQGKDGAMKASDPAFAAAVRDVVKQVEGRRNVIEVRSPLEPENRGQISADGRSALVAFEVRGDDEAAQDRIDPIIASVKKAAAENPQLRVEQFGGASASKALDKAFADDFVQAEVTSLPLTLIILVLAFGALVAALIPLLLAFSSVMIAIGLTALPSQLMPVDDAVNSVILLIGMAVGVDYALFYLRRAREERHQGRSNEDALAIAAATSGRAVLVSGLTVMIAMSGMFLTGDNTFSGFGIGTILVVLAAMIGSVTVLPAVLSLLGDRVEKARVPFLAKARARREERGETGRVWGWIVDRVLRHPWVATIGATALLIALAIPALGLHTADSGLESLPKDIPVMQTYERITKAFPGDQVAAEVVVKAQDVGSPQIREAIADLRERTADSARFEPGGEVTVAKSGNVAIVGVPIKGNGSDDASVAALDELRGDLVPAAFGGLGSEGTQVFVGGQTAGSEDFSDQMRSSAPLVFGAVSLMAFLLLLVTFRSVVIPLKAIVLNWLSVAAAYGVLVLVFQNEWAEGILGFQSTGGIGAWLPMFLFVILFGLSMDYHVFIVSRIREAFDGGMSNDQAVAHGIKSTAGVVTSAAVVMIAVFSIFATLGMLEFKQMGVGLAAAILIDATIIRGVLLPAAMKLLGQANWWFPRWLEWIPRFTPEPGSHTRPQQPRAPRPQPGSAAPQSAGP